MALSENGIPWKSPFQKGNMMMNHRLNGSLKYIKFPNGVEIYNNEILNPFMNIYMYIYIYTYV